MKAPHRVSDKSGSRATRFSAVLGGLLAVGLFLSASASASFEQVKTFESSGGQSPLSATAFMAVNDTGAGGIAAGTLFAQTPESLLRYTPEGELIDKTPAHGGVKGLAIDQATGNIYMSRTIVDNNFHTESKVQVFSPDGSELISEFGELSQDTEISIADSPEKFHLVGAVAVDDSGTVYVHDAGFPQAHEEGGQHSRDMVFKPQSPGDYTHYVYAGRANDFAVSHGEVHYFAETLATDAEGNLYTAADESIYEFAKGEPDVPVCEYLLSKGGIRAMSVDPENGEVFYLSYKDGEGHQLVCNSEGKFSEPVSPFPVTPRPSVTSNIFASAFSPTFTYSPDRPPGVLYAASNAGLGYIFAGPPVSRKPVVESESVSRVTTSSATLGAVINPEGAQASYHFQYISDAAYQENEPAERFVGAVEAPIGGAPLGSGRSPLMASVSISGLSPGMTYHYRAIATSPNGDGLGAEQTFRTFSVEAPGLPDGRAYELASPAQKNGGEVLPLSPSGSCGVECKPGSYLQHFTMQSSPEGNALAYEGRPFSHSEGAVGENEYVARRTPAGWVTTGLSPSLQSSGSRRGYKAFNPDLTRGLIAQASPSFSPEAPSGFANLYSQATDAPTSLSPLLQSEPPNRTPQGFQMNYASASADLSRVFFEANDALTGETAFAPQAVDGGESKNNLYEWADGQLSLVNVSPGNAETIPGAAFGSGTQLSHGGNVHKPDFFHAVSADGTRVFWSDATGQVYVRESGETTREIPDSGGFLTASADGSKVLLSDGHLIGLEGEPTVDLTEGQGGFQGILGQSEDLSDVYFVDTALLTGEEENDQGAKAQAGSDNLYAWHEGALVYVATLLASDNNPGDPDGIGDWRVSTSLRSAEASPDGRWVVFLSRARLTGYDNTGPCETDHAGGFVDAPCKEVFLYDSATGKFACSSCNPTGARPLGSSSLAVIDQVEDGAPQPRYLSNSGRLFFDSADSLSPFDTNGEEQVGRAVEDVYQYEPGGVGTCKPEAGCISLISAGHEPVDSNFLAADEDGKNVFFTTRDQLVLKDHDDLVDVYDAREGGGIPAEGEVAQTGCQGEACQAPVSAPNDPTPGSSTFEGAGNVNETKAAKKHAKKHKKKRQDKKKHAHKRATKRSRGGAK